LKNDKIKAYRFFALLLVLINIAIFIFLLSYESKKYEAAAALMLIGIYIFARLYIAKKNNHTDYFDELIFFILAGSWIGLQIYFMVFACAIMGILYRLALQKLKFVFSDHAVQKLNFPKSEYSWNSFTNVMIKDKILTLDLVSNKLMQLEIENDVTINEFHFNEFARQQIDMQKLVS
ncbi:MAG: hypothetical protein ABIO81_02960, partial [Ginsengibacter sp.]